MRSGVEWRAWGKADPLFGVAAWRGKRKDGPAPWTEGEFLATGAEEWEGYRRYWERYGVDRDVCVEIGCGAGRMTRPLAHYFRSVHAIDVSEEMLRYAANLVDTDNVAFSLNDGLTIPLADHAVTAAFSTFVFQHFDGLQAAERIFREIHRVLHDNGTMAIQLPIYLWPRPERIFAAMLACETFIIQRYADFWRWRLRRGKGKPVITYLAYDLNWLTVTLTTMGFADLTIHSVSAPTGRFACLFARKGASAGAQTPAEATIITHA